MAAVEIVEVSARDGIQNEQTLIATSAKVELIQRMVAAGARRLEVASFVNPNAVPQMAGAEDVIAALDLPDDVVTIGLVMNKRGAFRAFDTAVHELGLVCITSDTFAQRNQRQTAEESLQMAIEVLELARREGRRAQVTIGAAFGCPFEGWVPSDRVVDFARRLADAGAPEIALADTIGVAVPWQVQDVVQAVAAAVPNVRLRLHLHNTRNMAPANAMAAYESGVRVFDASVGGVGGCPFAPGATGNVATEDLLYMFERSGLGTGYDLAATIETAKWLGEQLGKQPPGAVSRAGNFPAN